MDNTGRNQLMDAVKAVVTQQRKAPSIQPISRDQELLLSFPQQRIWLLHQMDQNSSAYNRYTAYRLRGPLNVSALESSLREIIKRHEFLRTTYKDSNGQPTQVIADNPTFNLPIIDIQSEPEGGQESEALRLAIKESEKPFKLNQDLLLRVRLIQLSKEDFVLVLITHQIGFDGPSEAIFLKELSLLYESISTGQSSHLAKLSIQYADFAHWQRQWLKGEVLDTQLAYWRENFSLKVPLLPFNAKSDGMVREQFSAQNLTFEISKKLTQELKAISHREEVTLFVTLLSALQILINRLTQEEDFVVFVSTAGRNRPEIKELIGLFANILAIRADLSSNPSVHEILNRVRKQSFAAFAHQDLPFNKLLELIKPERKINNRSLFQVMFVYQDVETPAFELPGLKVKPFALNNGSTHFDLTFFLQETNRGLKGLLIYKKELFDALVIETIIEQYQVILKQIVDHQDLPLSDMPDFPERHLFSSQERVRFDRENHNTNESITHSNTVAEKANLRMESEIAEIWKELLGVDKVGSKDNFFDLGGDSYLCMHFMERFEKKRGIKIAYIKMMTDPLCDISMYCHKQIGDKKYLRKVLNYKDRVVDYLIKIFNRN